MNYVYSTLTCGTRYRVWIQSGNDLPTSEHSIVIQGGTGLANKDLITPYGVVTEVKDEDLAILETHEAFLRYVERGFIRVERIKTDPEKVAADMVGRDGSSPLVPQDFEQNNKKPPKTKDKQV